MAKEGKAAVVESCSEEYTNLVVPNGHECRSPKGALGSLDQARFRIKIVYSTSLLKEEKENSAKHIITALQRQQVGILKVLNDWT